MPLAARNIPIDDLACEQWVNVIAINPTGAFQCAQQACTLNPSCVCNTLHRPS